jgi:hypothetical protein
MKNKNIIFSLFIMMGDITEINFFSWEKKFEFYRCDSVSRSQRALVAEFERQRSRLEQLFRWYDHQQIARRSELRRQFDQVDKETRRQINTRSKIVIRERARLTHLLDDDNKSETSKPLFQLKDSDDKKRKVYGCLLPQLKAPLTSLLAKSCEDWTQFKSDSISTESDLKKHIEQQRYSINKYLESPIEQRNRMNVIIDKCLDELEQCEGNGYDHFLQTSEPNRNAQILAQQTINQKIK